MSSFSYRSTPIKLATGDSIHIAADGQDIKDGSQLSWGNIHVTLGKSRDEGVMLSMGFGGRTSGEFVGLSNLALGRVSGAGSQYEPFQLGINSPDMKDPWCESIQELSDKLLQPSLDNMVTSYHNMSREQKYQTRTKFDGRLQPEDVLVDDEEPPEINLVHSDMKSLLDNYKNVDLNDTRDLRQMQTKLPAAGDDWSLSPFQRGLARLSVMVHASAAVNGIDIFKAPMLAMMKEMSDTKLEDIADPKALSKGASILAPFMLSMPKHSQEYQDFIKTHWDSSCS
jgi:hypothetical protein